MKHRENREKNTILWNCYCELTNVSAQMYQIELLTWNQCCFFLIEDCSKAIDMSSIRVEDCFLGLVIAVRKMKQIKRTCYFYCALKTRDFIELYTIIYLPKIDPSKPLWEFVTPSGSINEGSCPCECPPRYTT